MEGMMGYIAFFGEAFSPARAEQLTGLEFSQKTERGEVRSRGRFKGQPSPVGHAVLEANGAGMEEIGRLMASVEPHVYGLKELGVTYAKVHVDYSYSSQCNMEFSPEMIHKLSNLGYALTISCYEVDESSTS